MATMEYGNDDNRGHQQARQFRHIWLDHGSKISTMDQNVESPDQTDDNADNGKNNSAMIARRND